MGLIRCPQFSPMSPSGGDQDLAYASYHRLLSAELWSQPLFPLAAVLLARADYDALAETAHLLRVPANARHLLESLEQARAGKRDQHDLVR